MAATIVTCQACKNEVGDDIIEADGCLICPHCGCVLDSIDLVGSVAFDTGGPVGVLVGADDGGEGAIGAYADPGGSHALKRSQATRRRQQIVDQIRAAGSVLSLPQGIISDAVQLVPQLQQTYADKGDRVNDATLAAVVYFCAREARYAIKLGQVAEPFSTHGLAVAAAFRRLLQRLELQAPLPNLDALLLRYATVVLPAAHLEGSTGGSLRQHPVISSALQLAELLHLMSATDGRSPHVAAGALLCMCLADVAGGTSATWAGKVAPLLGHNRSSMMGHVRHYEQHLGQLAHLLPYVDPDDPQELVGHARTLLQLYRLSQKAVPPAEQQQQQQLQGQRQPQLAAWEEG